MLTPLTADVCIPTNEMKRQTRLEVTIRRSLCYCGQQCGFWIVPSPLLLCGSTQSSVAYKQCKALEAVSWGSHLQQSTCGQRVLVRVAGSGGFSGGRREGNSGPILMTGLYCLEGRECFAKPRMVREGKPSVLILQLR